MSFLSEYKSGNRKAMENYAFQYLVTDLIQKSDTGYKKTREISGLNMEQMAPTQFIPSMFYMFMYVSEAMEKVGSLQFYDAVPMILCTSCDFNSITGINFNYIPNDVRASILDIITGAYKDFYSSALDGDGNFKINNNLGTILTQPKMHEDFVRMINNNTGIDISKCSRTYLRKNIIKCRMIEYDMWKYIPYVTFTDAVRGAHLASVQLATVQEENK